MFTSILSGWWGPSGYLYSRPLSPTNCPTRFPLHARQGTSGGSWGVGRGRRKERKRTSEPCSTAAGAYRGKLAGRTVPTDLGACWARHRFPPRVSAPLCVHTVVPYAYLCAHGRVAQGGPFVGAPEKAQERTFSCTPARTLADGRGGGEGFSGVLPLCRCLRFSPTTVLPLRYTRGPWPMSVSKAGAGESRSGEKRSGEHTP